MLLVGTVGTILLISSHASTPVGSAEAENGSITSKATKVTDNRASGSLAVKFGSAQSSSGCLTGLPLNDPGTADPWGGCWPGPQNTGVPAGTVLKRVPADITSGTGWSWVASHGAIETSTCNVTLNGLDVAGDVAIRQGNGTVSASTPCVTLKNSRVKGFIRVNVSNCFTTRCGPLLMTDDEVDTSAINVQSANVLYDNIYEYRVNDHGGNGPEHCDGNCEYHDGWYHALVPQLNFHMNAIGSNGTGAGNRLTTIHSYLSCGWDQAYVNPDIENDTNPGCTSDLALLPDFDTVTMTAENNYLAPAQITGTYAAYNPVYCLYPGQGTTKNYPTINDYIANNIFARGPSGSCGKTGPVYHWGNGDVHTNGTDSGNVWGPGNRYDDGTPINP